VDVGLDGGLARLVTNGNGAIIGVEAARMPCIVEAKGRRSVDPRALARWLIKASAGAEQVMVVYEQVHAMPKQGVSSVFSFGRSRGVTEGVIAALELPSLAVPCARGDPGAGRGDGRQEGAACGQDVGGIEPA
jgi:crossover junction endodeoxyribonuclease RuvC